MTLDLKLNGNRDLDLTAGAAILIDGASRVRQGIGIALRLWRGEYFLDSDAGVPYLTDILVKNPNRSSIEAVLRAAIREVEGVDSIDSLTVTIDREARTLAVAFTVTTGEAVVTDTILL